MKNHKSFQNLIFRTFSLFVLGIIAVLIISFWNFQLFLSNHYINYCNNTLSQTKNQIENVLGKMKLSQRQAFGMVCDSPVYKSKSNDPETVMAGRDLVVSLSNLTYTNDDIDNIFVYMYRYDRLYTTANYYYNKSNVCSRIDRNRGNVNEACCDFSLNENNDRIDTVNFYTYAYEMGTSDSVLGVCVSMKYKSFSEILDTISLHESQKIHLVTGDGTVIYSNDDTFLTQYDEIALETKVDFRKNEIVICQEIEDIDWYLIVEVDNLSLFISLFRDSFIVIGASGILITIICIVVAYSRSKALASPINEIIEKINGYPEKNKTLSDIKTNNAEVVSLVENYNRLIRRIENLHEENIRQEKEKINIEYKALLSQINPHFLFNVLDGLRGMAVKYRARDISMTIRSLSLMLQYSLVDSHESVTLQDELENLENYLTIVENESGEAVRKCFDIAEETKDLPVIRFMLQPIVENSMKFRPKNEESAIWLSTALDNKRLTIIVRDNGVGITKEKADVINEILEKGGNLKEFIQVRGTGVGLSNISKRLKYAFGETSEVRIEQGENCGVRVTITIDYSSQEE